MQHSLEGVGLRGRAGAPPRSPLHHLRRQMPLRGCLKTNPLILLEALYGFRTGNDHRRVPPDVLECGGHFPPLLTGTSSPKHKPGVGQVAPSCRRFGFGNVSVPKRCCGQGKAPSPRRGWNRRARIPGQRRWYPPWLRFDAVAPLCRRTPKQSGIHKEPCLIWNDNPIEIKPLIPPLPNPLPSGGEGANRASS